jgi:hypothetical protein
VTLIVLPSLIQGTDEWLEQRRGMVTASVVGQLITPSTIKPASNDKSRALVAQLVAERITGYVDPVFVSDDMLRGHEDEPRAVATYEEWRGRHRRLGRVHGPRVHGRRAHVPHRLLPRRPGR